LKRAQQVARSTTGKDLANLKAFFNWCIAHQLAVSNPVRRVKLFHEDNSRLRYLTREEYDRLIDAVRAMAVRASTPSPYLEEKIVLATHTGLHRGSLFDLRWEQIDLASSVMRIPRTKSGRPRRYRSTPRLRRHSKSYPRTATRRTRPSSPQARREGGSTGSGRQERLPRRPGARRHRRLHLARPAAHICVVADDARRVTPQRRRAARSPVDEDDDALRAPVAGVPVGRGQLARSAATARADESTGPSQNRKGQEKGKATLWTESEFGSACFC
jgi:integrase